MLILIFQFIILQTIMMLTSDLINKAKYYINHSNQRQIDLRNKSIITISSLNATMNYFQCIDLSNNLITKVQNTHYLDRVRSLVLANNKISSIGDLGESLPNLQNLFLMGNRIKWVQQVGKLSTCRHLTNLVLNNNPVTQQSNYRSSVIKMLPGLKTLDFKKVEKSQREGEIVRHNIKNK